MKKKIIGHVSKAIHFTVKNFIRLLFLLAVALAFAMAALWFLAVKYFNAQHAAVILTQSLQRALNRPVVMESIKLVSINAVEIKNLRIIDNNIDVYNELISVGSVVMHYNLLPIKEGRIEISEIILRDPVVSIVRDNSGVLNVSNIKAGVGQSEKGMHFELVSPVDGQPLQMVIEDWTINNGRFTFRDVAAKTSHSLNGVFLHFDNLKFNDFTDYSLKFVLRNQMQGRIIETEFLSSGAVNLANFAPSAMELKNAEIELRGLNKPLLLKVNARDFINPKISVSSSLPSISYEDISLFVSKPFSFNTPALNVKANLSISNAYRTVEASSLTLRGGDISADISGRADLSQRPFNVTAKFKTKDFEVTAVDYFNILKPYSVKGKINAEGNLVYAGGKISFPKFSANLNGVSALINNFVIENVKAKYEAENNFDTMNMQVQDGVFKVGRQIIERVKGRAAYEHKKQNFFALLDNSSFNGQNIKMSVAISKVRSEARRTVRTMLSVDTFNPEEVFNTVEDFVEALRSNNNAPKTQKHTGDLAWLRNFRASLPGFMRNTSGMIYAKNFESPILVGKNFTAEVSLKGLMPGMNNLTGTLDAKLENGKLLKMQEAADRWTALGIAFQPFVMMHNMEKAGSFKMGQILKDTPFEKMLASVTFDNGKMAINNFFVDGNVIAATVNGRVDWVAENMDLDIYTVFKNTSRRGALSENLTDESGEPALAFRASGSMRKPSIAIRSPKKNNAQIRAARERGLKSDFTAIEKFVKEK